MKGRGLLEGTIWMVEVEISDGMGGVEWVQEMETISLEEAFDLAYELHEDTGAAVKVSHFEEGSVHTDFYLEGSYGD